MLSLRIYILFIILLTVSSLHAQDSIPYTQSPFPDAPGLSSEETPKQPNNQISSDSDLSREGTSWEVASIQGKLKMQGLPLSPSLKIFMQKDSLISLSIRAPFVGEAGRLEITPDSVTVINKMKKTFVREGYRQWMDYIGYGALGLPEVQNLLLARFFLPGFRIEEMAIEEIKELIEVYPDGEQFNIIPKGEAELPGVKYGFAVDIEFNPLLLIVLPSARPDIEVDAVYSYKPQGYDLAISYVDSEKSVALSLELKNPEWTGEAPKPIDIRKFRQLTFPEFMKSF